MAGAQLNLHGYCTTGLMLKCFFWYFSDMSQKVLFDCVFFYVYIYDEIYLNQINLSVWYDLIDCALNKKIVIWQQNSIVFKTSTTIFTIIRICLKRKLHDLVFIIRASSQVHNSVSESFSEHSRSNNNRLAFSSNKTQIRGYKFLCNMLYPIGRWLRISDIRQCRYIRTRPTAI